MNWTRTHLKAFISVFFAATVFSMVVFSLVHFHKVFVFHSFHHPQKVTLISDHKDVKKALKKITLLPGSSSDYHGFYEDSEGYYDTRTSFYTSPFIKTNESGAAIISGVALRPPPTCPFPDTHSQI